MRLVGFGGVWRFFFLRPLARDGAVVRALVWLVCMPYRWPAGIGHILGGSRRAPQTPIWV